MKYRRVLAFCLAVFTALTVCGCGDSRKENAAEGTAAESAETASAQQTYAVGTYERKAADSAASGEEDPDAEIISFGSKSIFKGIQIETDENGEIVCTQADGELQYKISDKRFKSYYEFKKFVSKKSGAKAVDQFSQYFGERDGALCFIVGARERTVRDKSQYFIDDASKLIVNALHTEECRKKYKLAASDITFVRKKGIWKLESLTMHKE